MTLSHSVKTAYEGKPAFQVMTKNALSQSDLNIL